EVFGGAAAIVWPFVWTVVDLPLWRRGFWWRSGHRLAVRVDGGRSAIVAARFLVAQWPSSGRSCGRWSICHCGGEVFGGAVAIVWPFVWTVVDLPLWRRGSRWRSGHRLAVRVDGGRSATLAARFSV